MESKNDGTTTQTNTPKKYNGKRVDSEDHEEISYITNDDSKKMYKVDPNETTDKSGTEGSDESTDNHDNSLSDKRIGQCLLTDNFGSDSSENSKHNSVENVLTVISKKDQSPEMINKKLKDKNNFL